jgi:hypothetical protein
MLKPQTGGTTMSMKRPAAKALLGDDEDRRHVHPGSPLSHKSKQTLLAAEKPIPLARSSKGEKVVVEVEEMGLI